LYFIGTHVAGTCGGEEYGVAKNVNLIAVKVLHDGGAGSISSIIAGVEHVIGQKQANPDRPVVINLSVETEWSASLDDAVNRAVDEGVVVVVAAGNQGKDACSRSPAAAVKAITVGSTDKSDTRSSFSNIGSCVDIFA
jgi:subtilisin family serine protease